MVLASFHTTRRLFYRTCLLGVGQSVEQEDHSTESTVWRIMSARHSGKASASHLDECPRCRRRAAQMEQLHVKPVTKRSALQRKLPIKSKQTTFTTKILGSSSSIDSIFIIAHIHAISPEHAYVWHYSEKNIFVVNTSGRIEKTLELKTTCDVIDIAVSPSDGNLWYGCSNGAILEILKDGKNCKRFNTGFEPRCLCVASKGQILVGVECNVIVFKADGQKFTEMKNQNPNADLAELCPSKITQCPYTGNFCICDFFHHYFLLLDTSLRILWKFIGSTVIDAKGKRSDTGYSSPDLFWPFMAAFDKGGNVLIGNKGDSNALIVINRNGQFQQIISREEDEPYALYLHKEGQLWVGLDTKMVKVYKLDGK